VVRVEGVDVAEDLALLAEIRVGHVDQCPGAAHQPQVVDLSRRHHVREIRYFFRDEVGKAGLRVRYSEKGVEICTAEIRINEDDPIAGSREGGGEIGGDDRLAHAPLTASDGPDARTIRDGCVELLVHVSELTSTARRRTFPATTRSWFRPGGFCDRGHRKHGNTAGIYSCYQVFTRPYTDRPTACPVYRAAGRVGERHTNRVQPLLDSRV